jgi:acyl-coenzyme A thioesterase PaaI-like protein
MKPSLLRHGMNLWPPFLLTGIHVTEISPDWRRVRVELRSRPWNRNYVGTHFGGSLFAMTDPFRMIPMLHCLGRVHATFELDDAVLDELRAATASGEKVLRWFDADVIDEQGEVVARTRKQLYVRRKPGR